MPPTHDIEQEMAQKRLVLSMRLKVCAIGACFLLTVGLIAYSNLPNAAQALRSFTQNELQQNNTNKTDEEVLTLLFLNFTNHTYPSWLHPDGAQDGYYMVTQGTPLQRLPMDKRQHCGGFEIRSRCIDNNGLDQDQGSGVMFWGFMDPGLMPGDHTEVRDVSSFNSLRFECFSPGHDTDPANPAAFRNLAGLHAASIVNGTYAMRVPITGIDMTQWHNYTIEWREDQATFLIDGQQVAATSKAPTGPMDYGVWISPHLYDLYDCWWTDPIGGDYIEDSLRYANAKDLLPFLDPAPAGIDGIMAAYPPPDHGILVDHLHVWNAKNRLQELLPATEEEYGQVRGILEDKEWFGWFDEWYQAQYQHAEQAWSEEDYLESQQTLWHIRQAHKLAGQIHTAEQSLGMLEDAGRDVGKARIVLQQVIDEWRTAGPSIYTTSISHRWIYDLRQIMAWCRIVREDLFNQAKDAIESARQTEQGQTEAGDTLVWILQSLYDNWAQIDPSDWDPFDQDYASSPPGPHDIERSLDFIVQEATKIPNRYETS